MTEITLKTLSCDAFVPVFKRVHAWLGSGLHDQVGGLPAMRAYEKWPICKGCLQPMTFFLQATDPYPLLASTPVYRFFQCCSSKDTCDPMLNSQVDRLSYSDCVDQKTTFGSVSLGMRSAIEASYARDQRPEDEKANAAGKVSTEAPEGKPREYGITFPCYQILEWKKVVDYEFPVCDHHTEGPCPACPRDRWYMNQNGVHQGLKFHGICLSAQFLRYDDAVLQMQDMDPYLPYMWGDCGVAHINKQDELGYDCC